MRCGFHPWVWKIPWRRTWQHTPLFLPGESHGQRSLVGYSPKDHKELDTTEATACTHSTMTRLSLVPLRGMAYSFVELCKAVIHGGE